MPRIKQTISKVCQYCNGTYIIPKRYEKQKYCSHSCSSKGTSSVRKPKRKQRPSSKNTFSRREDSQPDVRVKGMAITQEILDAKKEEFFAKGGVIEKVDVDSKALLHAPDSLSLRNKNDSYDKKALVELYGDSLDVERSRKKSSDAIQDFFRSVQRW